MSKHISKEWLFIWQLLNIFSNFQITLFIWFQINIWIYIYIYIYMKIILFKYSNNKTFSWKLQRICGGRLLWEFARGVLFIYISEQQGIIPNVGLETCFLISYSRFFCNKLFSLSLMRTCLPSLWWDGINVIQDFILM